MIDNYFRELSEVWERMDRSLVERLIKQIYGAYEGGYRVFTYGNGGSAALASHFCEDLGKGTLPDVGAERRINGDQPDGQSPLPDGMGKRRSL